MHSLWTALLLVPLLVPGTALAQEKTFEVRKLGDSLYELSRMTSGGYPEKIVASVGADGLLIVDTGSTSAAPALVEALKAFGRGMPKIVINTHSHIEHLAANPVVAKGAMIIGHRNLRERYLSGLYYFTDFPHEFLPNLTFTDTLTLHFNGEEIRLASFIGAHDDSDIAVHFTGSKIAVVSALCMGNHFPSLDGDTDDIRKYPEVTARLLAWLPEDVRLVPGHAEDCDMAQGRRFLDMLRRTGDIVKAEIAKGKDLARLQAEDVLRDFASWESSYVKRSYWLRSWYEAHTSPRPGKPKPFAPVVAAYKEKGAAAAADRYTELRRTHSNDYWFEDQALMWIGRRLYRQKRLDEAKPFLERCITEYPGSEGASVSHSVLASVLEQQKDLAGARLHLAAYLGTHPEDAEAQKKLAQMDAALKK